MSESGRETDNASVTSKTLVSEHQIKPGRVTWETASDCAHQIHAKTEAGVVKICTSRDCTIAYVQMDGWGSTVIMVRNGWQQTSLDLKKHGANNIWKNTAGLQLNLDQGSAKDCTVNSQNTFQTGKKYSRVANCFGILSQYIR